MSSLASLPSDAAALDPAPTPEAEAGPARDSLGWRALFAVIAPSTNTSVEPEYAAWAPPGVTNHMSRIAIPDTPVVDDASFLVMLESIRAATLDAVDTAVSMRPDRLVVGMSAETFWDGMEGAAAMERRLAERAGVPVTMGSHAVAAALEALAPPGRRLERLAIVTPYMPAGDAQVRRFFEELGHEVVGLMGLRCSSPRAIAHVSEVRLRDAVIALDGSHVDAIVQVGTNLAFARVAAMAEFWLGKPVIAINAATYWHALRSHGIADRRPGWGALFERH